MLKLNMVVVAMMSLLSFNLFAEGSSREQVLADYEKCLEKQEQGMRIACPRPEEITFYERCREMQEQGYKIGCNNPLGDKDDDITEEVSEGDSEDSEAMIAYRECRAKQERGMKIACHKPSEADAEDSDECVISENEESSSKTCHGETWVRITANPDGTLGESEQIRGQEVVDVPVNVHEFLEGGQGGGRGSRNVERSAVGQ